MGLSLDVIGAICRVCHRVTALRLLVAAKVALSERERGHARATAKTHGVDYHPPKVGCLIGVHFAAIAARPVG